MAGKRRIWVTVGIVCLLAALGILYACVDPLQARWMPKCLWLELTGWRCPGCGSQRVAHSLLNGDIQTAWQANPFLVLILPVLLFLLVVELLHDRLPRLYAAIYRPATIYVTLALIVGWAVARNLLDL